MNGEVWPSRAAVEAAHWAMDGQLMTLDEDTGRFEPVEDEEQVVKTMVSSWPGFL